ncbi:MAG: hypothetical protein R3E04_04400 [Sphingobium sp.]
MFGFNYSRLFKSRRSALLWSAGVLLFAWSVASSEPSDDARSDAGDPQAIAIAHALRVGK